MMHKPEVEINCIDVLQGLRSLKSNSIDLIITSPPYNIGKEYEVNKSLENYVEWCSEWMNQIYRVTKPEGSFWLNLGYFEVPGKGKAVPISYFLWDKSPFYLVQEIVWHYGA